MCSTLEREKEEEREERRKKKRQLRKKLRPFRSQLHAFLALVILIDIGSTAHLHAFYPIPKEGFKDFDETTKGFLLGIKLFSDFPITLFILYAFTKVDSDWANTAKNAARIGEALRSLLFLLEIVFWTRALLENGNSLFDVFITVAFVIVLDVSSLLMLKYPVTTILDDSKLFLYRQANPLINKMRLEAETESLENQAIYGSC